MKTTLINAILARNVDRCRTKRLFNHLWLKEENTPMYSDKEDRFKTSTISHYPFLYLNSRL